MSEVVGTILIWVARLLGVFVVVATVMPMLQIGYWQVRLFDFPRVQMLSAAIVVVALIVVIGMAKGWRAEHGVLIAAVVAAGLWQAFRILPYTAVWKREVATARGPIASLMVCNLDKRNTQHTDVAAMLLDASADVLILIELDERWRDGLEGIRDGYTHHAEAVRPDGLGIGVWSKFTIRTSEVRELVSDRRPSIHADLETPGGKLVRLVAIHPTPPGLPVAGDSDERYDSRIRDAELMLVAREIEADPDHHWVVAGDFNDVAWSHTTRLFRRVSGLADPRIGRGLLNTYHARYWFARYPLDHVFVSAAFRAGRFERVRTPGSDHFAVLVELGLDGWDARPADGETDTDDRAQSEDLIEEGQHDADERGE